jgi:DNA-binding XRE family transcriptional regulator
MAYPNNMLVYRNKADLTQGELALRCGVSQPRISSVEKEFDTSPPLALLTKIAKEIAFPGDPKTLQEQFVAEDKAA